MKKVDVFFEVKKRIEALAICQDVSIEKYYLPNCQAPSKHNLSSYYEELCGDIQDGGFVSGVINFWGVYRKESDGTVKSVSDVISEITSGFNPQYVVSNYNNWTELMNQFCEALPERINRDKNYIMNGSDDTTAETTWQKYVKGLYQGAEYLTMQGIFADLKPIDFFSTAKPTTIEEVKELLFHLRNIKSRITGLGFPLCYNWIKECGAEWLAKPDMYICQIVDHIITSEYGSWNAFMKEYEIYKKYPTECPNEAQSLDHYERVALYMWDWAREIHETDSSVTPYKLDRILFLYCTGGYFYKEVDKGFSKGNLIKMLDQ